MMTQNATTRVAVISDVIIKITARTEKNESTMGKVNSSQKVTKSSKSKNL